MKVSDDTAIVPSFVLFDVKCTVTSAVGCECSETLNVACVLGSAVAPEIAVTSIPAVSLSVLLTLTLLGGVSAVYSGSLLVTGSNTIA